jgi:hypothetical protein
VEQGGDHALRVPPVESGELVHGSYRGGAECAGREAPYGVDRASHRGSYFRRHPESPVLAGVGVDDSGGPFWSHRDSRGLLEAPARRDGRGEYVAAG